MKVLAFFNAVKGTVRANCGTARTHNTKIDSML